MNAVLAIIMLLFSIKAIGGDMNDSSAFRSGKMVLEIGYGYPNMDNYIYNNSIGNDNLGFGISFKQINSSGPIHFRGTYGISNHIGIGISMNYDSYGGQLKIVHIINHTNGVDEYYNYKKQVYSLSGLIRFSYHFAVTKKIDPYIAIGGGFLSNTIHFTTNDTSSNAMETFNNYVGARLPPASFEFVAGMRYYFSKHIGIYAEVGLAKSLIQFGIVSKF